MRSERGGRGADARNGAGFRAGSRRFAAREARRSFVFRLERCGGVRSPVVRARRRSRTAGRATAAAAASATAPTAASRASPSAASRRAATGRTARARAVLAREARETLFFARDDPRRARSAPARGAEASDDDISRRRGALRDPWARAWVCATTAGGGLLRGSATDDPARERQRTPAKKAACVSSALACCVPGGQKANGCTLLTRGGFDLNGRSTRQLRLSSLAVKPKRGLLVGPRGIASDPSDFVGARLLGSRPVARVPSVWTESPSAFKALDRWRARVAIARRALVSPPVSDRPRALSLALHPLSHPTRRYVLLPEHALRRRGGRLRQARRARRQGPRGPQGVRAHDQGSRQAQQQRFQVALRHQHLPGASRGATARPPERAREAPREATLAPVRRRPRAAFVRARARPGEARPDGASAPDQRTTFSPAPRRRLLFPPVLSSLQLDSSGTSEARRYFRSSDTRRDFLEPPFDRRLRGRLTDASVLLHPFR